LQQDSNGLLMDVQDAANIPTTGIVPGGIDVSLGLLPVRADLELPEEYRDTRLPAWSGQIITICVTGPNAATGAKQLKEMGFTNVSFMQGGMQAWREAGLPTG